MAVMHRYGTGMEAVGDELQHIVLAGQVHAVTATSVVDIDIVSEQVGQQAHVSCIDTAIIAMLECADIFEVRQLLKRICHGSLPRAGQARFTSSRRLGAARCSEPRICTSVVLGKCVEK